MLKSQDLIGKPIVTIAHGEIIARVKDVLTDPDTRGRKSVVQANARSAIEAHL